MDKKSITRIVAVFVIVVCVCMGVVCASLVIKNKQDANTNNVEVSSGDSLNISGDSKPNESTITSGEESGDEEEYLGPNIFSGDSRSIAIMIDNEKPAWQNHGGLNSAYMLYEFIIEGGESRIMAFFKNVQPKYIGPVRSARHYFLDYAMEHDAIFVHFGWSPLAQSNIKELKINNINGIYDTFFWRVKPLSSYHNAITSMSNVLSYALKKGYRTTSDNECVVKYNQYDEDIENGQTANLIKVTYSALQNASYEYDAERKVYLRSMRGQAHKDSQTGEQFYAKNIIMIFVKDELLDDPEDKGRRNLYNIGTGSGFYATNGKIQEIKWKKDSRSSRTIYYDDKANEISVNDGITWVQIVPLNGGSVKFE